MNNNVSIENKITVNTVNTNSNTINTIPEEWQALGFIQGLLCRSISPERVTIRDARSYCAVLVDDNNRKTLARLYLEGAKKKIELPKIEKVIELQSFSDLKKAKSSLFAALNKIENKALPEPQEAPESNPADDTARALQNAAELAHAHAVADFYEDKEQEATPQEPEQPEPVAALPEPEPEPQDQQEQAASEEQAETIEPPQFKEQEPEQEPEQDQQTEPEPEAKEEQQESKEQEINYFDYLNI